jgi:hypothetical protein
MRVDVNFVLEPQGKGQSRATWAIEVEGYRFHSEGVTVLTEQNAALKNDKPARHLPAMPRP